MQPDTPPSRPFSSTGQIPKLKKLENFLLLGLLLFFLACGCLLFLRPMALERQAGDLQRLDFLLQSGLFLLNALLLGLLLAWRVRKPGLGPVVFLLTLWAFLAALSCITAWALFPGRLFSLMRFTGWASFVHLPCFLMGLAFLSRHRVRFTLALGAVGLWGIGLFAYRIEPGRLEVRRFTWSHPLLRGLERPVQLALISDIQTDAVGEFQKRIFSELERQRPDLVVHTGDYVQTWTLEEYDAGIDQLHQLLAQSEWRPPLGAFATIGDTDISGNWEALFREGLGTVLLNETKVIQLPGVAVNLTGLSVARSRARQLEKLREAQMGRLEGSLDIIFGHSPDFAELLSQQSRPFLALAGHTHGGQVRLPGIGPLLTFSRLPRFLAEGFHPMGPGALAVSRGLGMERLDAPRLRFLCRPEILLVELRPPVP